MAQEAIDAVRALGRSFRALGLEPPAAITLASRIEGLRFLSLLPRESLTYDPKIVGDYVGCKIAGVVIRWPEN